VNLYQVSATPTMVKDKRIHFHGDLPDRSNHFQNVGIIIINTGITTNVQLNRANVEARNSDSKYVFELFVELSKSSAVANATEIAPAVAVTNPSSKNVPRDKEVKARAEAGASKKNTDFFEVFGNTTSQTAANAYPRIEISSAHVNEWLIQSDWSLALESLPNVICVPEFNSTEIVCGNNGEPISIKSRWAFFAMA